jgi:hypothetical protein
MKRISTKNKILIPCITIIALEALNKDNVLRIDDGIEYFLWATLFPVLLIISLILFVWASRSSKLYRELQKEISSKILRFVGSALLVVLPTAILVFMVGTTIRMYVNHAATTPFTLVIDSWEIGYRDHRLICSKRIKIHRKSSTSYLCIERIFGLPTIKTSVSTQETGSLCVRGRENSVGAVVDQITIIPKQGLDMDAKQLRCTQLFSDT